MNSNARKDVADPEDDDDRERAGDRVWLIVEEGVDKAGLVAGCKNYGVNSGLTEPC